MAIEKMVMMNVVGLIEDVNDVSREVVLMENVDIVNALNEINESHFTLSVTQENVDELVGMSLIKPLHEDNNYDNVFRKIKALEDIYEEDFIVNRKHITKEIDFKKSAENIDALYNVLMNLYKEIIASEDKLRKIDEFYRNFIYVKDLDIKLETLNELFFFTYTFGILSKENIKKLKKNYENITAIVLHTGSSSTGEVYLIVSPKELELETNRILRSLSFHKIELPEEFVSTPIEIINKLEIKRKEIEKELIIYKKKFSELKKAYRKEVEECYSILKLQEKIKEVKKQMVSSNIFFYFSGWTPENDKEKIRKSLDKFDNLIIVFRKEDDINDGFEPPTKLKNKKLFKPFEHLVKMYGVPSYSELDPTVFLGFTYMFLFGAMFGDIGQGLVLFLSGILLNKKAVLFGSIINRLGISSMIFGFLYGSFFGFEDVIPALLIKPFKSINTVLISAVVIGICLLLISYVYSIINAVKQRNLKEGLFGRNGIAGLMFYIMLLLLIGNRVVKIRGVSTTFIILALLILSGVMIIKEPLTNIILNKHPLYHESISSYYIESSFEILETLLSMLSSTVSFIRVGAFALTHVGLFVAFETIAHLLDNVAGSVIVFALGNIIIIGLEGLIVFIQGLRLEYYELFSKYFSGEGIEFDPIKLNN